MGFFKRLFDKRSEVPTTTDTPTTATQNIDTEQWVAVEKFIPSNDPVENKLISVLMAAIAAGDNQKSHFSIKNIQKLNPKFKLVSLLATSIAAGDAPEKKFIVKSIQRKVD